ncbi:MAG TPA: serine/threonine-protein kinase, partial [Phycisphaerales bacterium]|nr:serine/threonine-protein kinase [Phycisphaerales bacterium]
MMFTASGMHDSSGVWSASGSRSLADLLQSSASKDDDELAYVIDVAARRGLLALDSLEEFFRLVPRLAERPVVLDAAIDAVIQVRERAGESRSKLIADLQVSYPEHKEAIQVAAALSSVVVGSSRGGASGMGASRSLPEDLGPVTPDGLPRYSLREALGSGSQGQVYLAVDRLMSRDGAPSYVAVKFLRGHVILQADQRTAAEEAIKARRISHPSVARVIDRGVSLRGESYVVFEHVDGGNAEHHIRRHGPLTERDAARLVVAVARGIQAIHAAGLFHCDLKPSNVLLTRSGEPRITDFGLARWVSDRGVATPGDEQGNGAIGFAAPEQFEGTQPLTAACDVYALGGLVLYLATGAVPNGESPTEARRNVFTGSSGGPINSAAVGRLRDPVLRSICARALHRDPRERHSSAEAFANDIERWLRHEAIDWIPQPASQRIARWLRRERKAVIAAFVFLLIAAAGILWGGQQYIEGREQRILKE